MKYGQEIINFFAKGNSFLDVQIKARNFFFFLIILLRNKYFPLMVTIHNIYSLCNFRYTGYLNRPYCINSNK